MQIVISISDSLYDRLIDMDIDSDTCSFNESALVESIKNGTPLPKGHGKLVDVKQVIMALVYRHLLKDDVTCGDVTKILNMATIIEADKEEKQDEIT